MLMIASGCSFFTYALVMLSSEVNGDIEYAPGRSTAISSSLPLNKDQYFILKDFDAYAEAHKRVNEAYKDQEAWAKMAMTQTVNVGKFTADRTIAEYAKEIWKLKKVTVKLPAK